jgi:membrane-bound lytic murein transglycosylase MltF
MKISVILLIQKVLVYFQHIASEVFSCVTKNQNEWFVFANYAWIFNIQTELRREVR